MNVGQAGPVTPFSDRPAPWRADMTFRAMLERVTALADGHWSALPHRRAFVRPPDGLRASIRQEPLPGEGRPLEETFDLIEQTAAQYPLGPGHPRWWAFIAAAAHPAGIAAEMVATALNNPCFTGAQVATDYEHLVIRWLAELCAYPPDTGGVLVSGGSMANLVCLHAARQDMERRGVSARTGRVAVYHGGNAHYSVGKCLKLLGLPTEAGRAIRTQPDGRLDVGALRATLVEDRARGVRPLAIIGTAGTAGRGVVDDLASLADVAAEADCWYHVDGAYGAPAASLPELAPLFAGIERADSLVVDPHKWLYVPYEAGAALVRRPEVLHAAFASDAPYVEISEDSYFGDRMRFQDRGPQQSRAFRALKVWATLRSLGTRGLAVEWRRDIQVAAEVCRLAAEHPRLEVMSRGDLSIFVVRYLPRSGDPNEFNRRLLDEIHRDGRLFLGPMTIDDRFGLRGCIVNFRSTLEDARICVQTILDLGERLDGATA